MRNCLPLCRATTKSNMMKHAKLLLVCCLLSFLLAGCTRTQQQKMSDASDRFFDGLAEMTDNVVEWLVEAKESVIDWLTTDRE